jgi:uncharacterized membrane protein
MSDSAVIVILWLLFGGTHILLCVIPVRHALERKIGNGFKGLYALISLVSVVALFWYYFTHRHGGADLWSPTLVTRLLAAVLMLLALVILGMGVVSPAPSSMSNKGGSLRAQGLIRITRHPVAAAFFLFGLAHCLVLGRGTDLVFFGGWCIFTLLATWHQDARKTSQVSGYGRLRNETSFLPFLAGLSGKQLLKRALNELSWIGVLIGVVVFVLLAVFHKTIFGGTVF